MTTCLSCSDETRFQGIATPPGPAGPSGLGDRAPCSDETRFQGIATISGSTCSEISFQLAVTRPVFRGLRPVHRTREPFHHLLWLAVTRPVFRGLRRSHSRPYGETREPPCSDETRFQGIATFTNSSSTPSGGKATCSDETRFQGIATRQGGYGGVRRIGSFLQ